MPYPYLVDCHLHSDNSPDGKEHVSYICERAAEQGFYAIAITDHCECNLYEQDNYGRSVRQSIYEVLKSRAIFRTAIRTLLGLELGQPMQGLIGAERALSLADYDFVIGSLHNVVGQPDFAFIDFNKVAIGPLIRQYYEEVLDMVRWGEFDVLGHLTYPLRYITGVYKIEVDLSPVDDTIDEIFKVLISKGKGIEINTSGLRQPLGKTMPHLPYLKRYRELGGKILTIGSDAHCVDDVGKGIVEGMDLAKEAGFTHITFFEKRKPKFVPLFENR